MSRVYIAIAPCGCVHAADSGDGPETHALIAEWIKKGSHVKRVSEVEAMTFDDCRKRAGAVANAVEAACVPSSVTLWRCDGCGKWSHAKRRPKNHERFVTTQEARTTRHHLHVLRPVERDDYDGRPEGVIVACGPFTRWTATEGGPR